MNFGLATYLQLKTKLLDCKLHSKVLDSDLFSNFDSNFITFSWSIFGENCVQRKGICEERATANQKWRDKPPGAKCFFKFLN